MKAIVATSFMGIIMMFLSFLMSNRKHTVIVATLLMAVLVIICGWEGYELSVLKLQSLSYFNNQYTVTKFGAQFNLLMAGCGLLYFLLFGKSFQTVGANIADYFALIFFIFCGIFLLTGANTLLILFIGIEMISIPQYILAGSDKKNLKSSEASLKYFLLGSFSTGILLMGIALLYGATGTFFINSEQFSQMNLMNPMALMGILLMIIAFAFKVSAAPMHLWTADVYDGSPTPFTPFMASIVKAAAFFAFINLFHVGFQSASLQWQAVLILITVLTLLTGNITAVYQQSVKRMLAYSSIAQAGFMLFLVIAIKSPNVQNALLLYAVAYSLATLGIFSILIKLKDYTFDGFNGLAKREPLMAFCTTIFIMSLAGIPLTGGFMAKYYAISALLHEPNKFVLVVFALLMAAVSVYYYFKVIISMYFKKGIPQIEHSITKTDKIWWLVTAFLIILIGVLPNILMNT